MTYAQLHVETRQEWRAWLALHHGSAPGIWLVTWKKATGRPRPTYDDIVEEALCAGWVDSLPRTLDDARSQLLVTPRKPGSTWSRINTASEAAVGRRANQWRQPKAQSTGSHPPPRQP